MVLTGPQQLAIEGSFSLSGDWTPKLKGILAEARGGGLGSRQRSLKSGWRSAGIWEGVWALEIFLNFSSTFLKFPQISSNFLKSAGAHLSTMGTTSCDSSARAERFVLLRQLCIS